MRTQSVPKIDSFNARQRARYKSATLWFPHVQIHANLRQLRQNLLKRWTVVGARMLYRRHVHLVASKWSTAVLQRFSGGVWEPLHRKRMSKNPVEFSPITRASFRGSFRPATICQIESVGSMSSSRFDGTARSSRKSGGWFQKLFRCLEVCGVALLAEWEGSANRVAGAVAI
jgi:hypothetical protein